jgi:ABC-2 type transport system ATP-binding protein
MIKVANLTKYYSKAPLFADFNISIDAQKVCITAPNGRGKSTLFRLIAGIEGSFSGQITVNSLNDKPQSLVALASDGIVFPSFMTAKQILELTCASWQSVWPQELIDDFRFDAFLDTKVNKLSSGNQKKLQLINAMLRKTPVLILDEPSAALDSHAVTYLLNWCKTYTGQLVISCHEPDPFESIGFVLQPLDGEVV